MSLPRYKEIALYTGNDDNIIVDLLTNYRLTIDGEVREKSIVGGLLGQWGVWTRKAVELLGNDKITERVNEIWPETQPLTSEEISARINEIKKIVQSGSGDKKLGQLIYRRTCGGCHALFGEGGVIGPDLTGV